MFTQERPVWCEIDLNNIEHNINNIRKVAKDKRILSVVKANAYGHGMKECSQKLKSIGINDFAVAILDEALEFRKFDKDSSILILGFTSGLLAEIAIENNVTCSLFSYEEAKAFSEAAVKLNKVAKIAITLDTGMHRIGFQCEDNNFEKSYEEIQKISKLPNIQLEEIFSHFSTSDELDKTYSKLQLDRYGKMIKRLRGNGIVFNHYHHSNSAAIIDFPDLPCDTVRPGIIQYGYYPSHDVNKEKLELKPILEWYANIVMIKEIEEGEPVSYGNTFVSKRKTVVGTVPLGYADGYNRCLSNNSYVVANGKKIPVIGRVCMDQMMVDLTDATDIKVGDPIKIIGTSGDVKVDADDLAKRSDTISYEILCGISLRVPRKYK